MEEEENLEVDQNTATEALRRGLATGKTFLEKLEKMTMLDCGEGEEEQLSVAFEKFCKFASRHGNAVAKDFKVSQLSQFGFDRRYVQKIGYNAIRIDSQSPPKYKSKQLKRLVVSDDHEYEEDFEVDEDEELATISNQKTRNDSIISSSPSPEKMDVHNLPRMVASNSTTRISTAKRKSTVWINEGRWKLGEKIGSGSFGDVFQCMNDKGKLFAVKRLQMAGHANDIMNLVDEIQLMRQLSHPNIVEYMGAKVRNSVPPFIFCHFLLYVCVSGGREAGTHLYISRVGSRGIRCTSPEEIWTLSGALRSN